MKTLLFLMMLLVSSSAYAIDGVQLTKGFEGFRSTSYLDTKGILHIGYGFNCKAMAIDCSKPMTKEQAEILFLKEYRISESIATDYAGKAWLGLTSSQKTVLTDMAYNLHYKLHDFKDMKQAILSGDDEAVKVEMKDSLWFNQVGNRGKELVKLW